MHRFIGLLGMATMIGLAFALSTNRRAIRYKTVAWGLGLQIVFAFLVMRWDFGRRSSRSWARGRTGCWISPITASTFVFGDLGQKNSPKGFYFAFQALPTIIFIAAFFAVLYYLGVMQVIVKARRARDDEPDGRQRRGIAERRRQHFHGPDRSSAHHSPVSARRTRSELMTIMTSGMAHVSGGMMAAYMAYGIRGQASSRGGDHDRAGNHPLAKILVPETEKPLTAGRVEMAEIERDVNVLGAISRGTIDGLHLALNVAAMLISFIALIYLVDGCFGAIHNLLARTASAGFRRASSRFSAGFFRRSLG